VNGRLVVSFDGEMLGLGVSPLVEPDLAWVAAVALAVALVFEVDRARSRADGVRPATNMSGWGCARNCV